MKKGMKRVMSLILMIIFVFSMGTAYAWNSPSSTSAIPTAVTDPVYMAPFTDGLRAPGKAAVNDLPAMGWNSWNPFQKNINEDLIKAIADSFIRLGLDEVGYEYVVIDDGCYHNSSRDSEGKLQAHPTNFPSGFKNISDHIHDLGLKYGMYQDSGARTCGGQPGSWGNEDLDAETLFLDWGVDYLKYDFCGNPWDRSQYSFTPYIRSISVSDGVDADEEAIEYTQTVNAVDGSVTGYATKNISSNRVEAIGIDNNNRPGELFIKITVPVDGTYQVAVNNSVASNSSGRWMQMDLNGVRVYDAICPSTGSYDVYQDTIMALELKAGESELRFYNNKRRENALQCFGALYDGLVKTGRADEVKFSICEWGYNQPWTWGYKVGDSWRITTDIANVAGQGYWPWMKYQLDRNVILDEYAGLEKGWNDPDMMVVGLRDSSKPRVDGVYPNFTHEEDIAHFSGWCMMNAPLMLGLDLTKVQVGDPVHQVITNADVIALNQDPLGVQAKRVKASNLSDPSVQTTSTNRMDITAKPLANGDIAVMFWNLANNDRSDSITINEILSSIGHKMVDVDKFEAAKYYKVNDLWTKEVTNMERDDSISVTLPSHNSKTIRISLLEPAIVEVESPKSIVEVDEVTTVVLRAKDAVDLYAFDLSFKYDTSIFELLEIDVNEDYTLGDVGIEEGEGGVLRVIGTLKGAEEGINGDVDLVTLSFKSKDVHAIGSFNLRSGSILSDKNGNLNSYAEAMKEIVVTNADITGGGVNISDLVLVAKAFGKEEGMEGYEARLDMNLDKVIDIQDLAYVALKIQEK